MEKLHEMSQKLEKYACNELEKGMDQVDTHELGEVIDMLKDIAETKKYCAETEYYEAVVEAMEDAEYGEDYDWEGRLGYSNRMNRSGSGSRQGRRGYDGNMMPDGMNSDGMDTSGARGYSNSRRSGRMSGTTANMNSSSMRGTRYGYSHDKYMQERKMYSKDDPDDKAKRAELLDEYMEDLTDSAKEMVTDMTPEEKNMWKVRLNRILNM